MTKRHIPEHRVEGKRLGRHVNHDPRSRSYQVLAGVIDSVAHVRREPILDQGSLGSCTGNAIVGALGTAPHVTPGLLDATKDEGLAVSIYSEATRLDPFDGAYPPDDTGSDGLSVCKVAKTRGLISGYTHALSLTAALTALQQYPVITGVNWYDSFDKPSSSGMVKIAKGAQVRGGHEFEVLAVDATAKTVTAANSWGPGWGAHGYFTFSWDDWDRLLGEDGDVTVPIPATQPPPVPVDPTDLFAKQTAVWIASKPTRYPTYLAQARSWLASRKGT